MTLAFKKAKIPMARCQACSHDLVVSKDNVGMVVCSNRRCRFRHGHPTLSKLNSGK